MSLLEYYQSSNQNLEKKTIRQIVSFAGEDGKLTDGSLAQEEIRKFFSLIETNQIIEYSNYCLENPFDDSGLVLQDLVNEMGKRLNFDVRSGFYQGSKNRVGVDGV